MRKITRTKTNMAITHNSFLVRKKGKKKEKKGKKMQN